MRFDRGQNKQYYYPIRNDYHTLKESFLYLGFDRRIARISNKFLHHKISLYAETCAKISAMIQIRK
jgi:hypothetical protein